MEPRQQIASAEGEGDGVTTAQWLRLPTAAVDRRRVHPEPFFHHRRLPKKGELHRPRTLQPTEAADVWEQLEPRHVSSATAAPRQAGAMRVMPPPVEEDHIVAESCDVEMGTPTATTVINCSDWQGACVGEDKHENLRAREWRIQRFQETTRQRSMAPISPLSYKSSFDEHTRQHTNEPAKEEQILEFCEYDHDEIDRLDIQPSQDFVGEIPSDGIGKISDESSSPTNPKSKPQSSSWFDFHDGTQHREESSEIFDNVIYAPAALSQRAPSHKPSETVPALPCKPSSSPSPAKTPHIDPDDQYEDESDLSDAELDTPPLFNDLRRAGSSSPARKEIPTTLPPFSSRDSSSVCSPPGDPLRLCARMSVKRDCSFVDQSLKHRRKHLSVQDLSESGGEFVEKLKLVDRDEERDGEDQVPKRPNAVLHSSGTAAVDAGLLLPGFRPKKKRRKVRQLALDTFLKIRPSATY